METKKYFHSRPIFYCFLALLLGISATKFLFELNAKYIALVVIVFAAFLLYCAFKRRFLTFILIFLTFLFGFAWYFVGISTFVGKEYDTPVEVVGRVSDDLFFNGEYSNCVLKDVYINGEKQKNISLSVKDTGQLEMGDVLAFTGEVENVQLFTLGSFDSASYRDRTPYICKIDYKDITVQEKGRLIAVEAFRQKVKTTLYTSMGEKNGAVAFAILFGDKSDIDKTIYKDFKSSGVIHLLTVSGLHVSFLFALLGFVLKKLKVKGWLNLLICAALLFLYAYACNFTPSILRAGIMGLVLVFTKFSGKCYDSLNSIGLAGLLILLVLPLSAFDVGCLMSFFCVLSIAIISPWLRKLLNKTFPQSVATAFAVSIGVEIGILPFLAQIYSSFNFLTFFVNLLVVPIFSVLYPLLFLSTFICLGLPFMAFLLKICSFGLDIILAIVNFFGQTGFIWTLKPINVLCTTFAFAGLFLLGRNFMASKKVRAVCCCTLFALSGICFGLGYLPNNKEPSVSYVFNYTNSLVVLTNSQGKTVCVDLTGNTQAVFYRLGIKRISAAFVLQEYDYDFEYSRELDIPLVIRCSNSSGFAEEVVKAQGQVQGFSYAYIFDGETMLGLEFNFDDRSVFILRDKKVDEKALDNLSEKNYNVILTGRQDVGAHFSGETIVLSYYANSHCDYSFKKDGNIKISLKNNKRRLLD